MNKQVLKVLKYFIPCLSILIDLILCSDAIGIRCPFNYSIINACITNTIHSSHGQRGDAVGTFLFFGAILCCLLLVNLILIGFFFFSKTQPKTKKRLFVFITILTLLQLAFVI
jgi:hypothetical protein